MATSGAVVLEAALLCFAVPDFDLDARRFPLPVAGLALIAPWLWVGLNTVGSKLDKELGIRPIVGPLEREVVEESAQSLLRKDRKWRLLGEPGDTRPNMALVFLFWVAAGAGLASTGAPVLSLPSAGVRVSTDWIDDLSSERVAAEGQEDHDGSQTGEVDETAPAPPGTSVSPSEAAAEPTAFDICGYWPETTFAEDEDVPDAIAARLSDTYYQVGGGAGEVGCPHAGVDVYGDLYTSILTNDELDSALIVIARQEDAVVFHQLYLYAWRLLKRESLAWVETKKSTGVGDYQVFHLTNGSCVLAVRNLYRDDEFVVLPSIVSHAVMRATVLKEEFPEIYERDPAAAIVGRGRFSVEWPLPTGRVERLVLTKRNAPDAVEGLVGEVFDPIACPDVDAFDLVAVDALRQWEEEAE